MIFFSTLRDSINYENLEPHMRELCRALNESGLARTLWSCEGHRPSLFDDPRPGRPFVIFEARFLAVRTLRTALFRLWLARKIRFDWIIRGEFIPKYAATENGEIRTVRAEDWHWVLEPQIEEPLGAFSFLRERRLRSDLAALPDLLRQHFHPVLHPVSAVQENAPADIYRSFPC